MNLNLKKPIVFFDLETTGLNIGQDRIVEIALLRVNTNGSEESKCFRVNPEMTISPESVAIHGITNEDVADKPTLIQLAAEIVRFLEGSDLAGFNLLKFDVPFLVEELMRVGYDMDLTNRRIIDVQRIYHKLEPRNLAAAYQFYCDKNLENAHSADADNLATYEVYKAQIERYDELENDSEFIHQFTGSPTEKMVDLAGRIVKDEKDRIVFNFGKHKGKPVADIFKSDPSYYSWIMNGDFPLYTKKKLTELRLQTLNNK